MSEHLHKCGGCDRAWPCSVHYCQATAERACWDCRVRGLVEDVPATVAAVTRAQP